MSYSVTCKQPRTKAWKKIGNHKVHSSLPEIYIGGLPSFITEKNLHQILATYGDIVGLRIMFYSDGKSRGFGFVKFSNLNAVNKLLSQSMVYIAGKRVECKLAMSKEEAKVNIELEMHKKIYVGNLSSQISEKDLADYFTKFGSVRSVRIVTSIQSDESRGFAFVTFDNAESAEYALNGISKHILNEMHLLCKPAFLKSGTEVFKNEEPLQIKSIKYSSKLLSGEEDNLVFHRRKKEGHPCSLQQLMKLRQITASSADHKTPYCHQNLISTSMWNGWEEFSLRRKYAQSPMTTISKDY